MSLSETESIAAELGISGAVIESRMAAVNLSALDRACLRKVWPIVEKESGEFIRRLYQRFRQTPQLAPLLAHESRVERLMGLQQRYLQELFCDPIENDYVLRRLTIGLVHHRIRVTPQWYLATCAHFVCEHVDLFFTISADREQAINLIDALHKSILFDAALVLDAYGRREEASLAMNRQSVIGADSGEQATQLNLDASAAAMESRVPEPGISRIRLSDTETQVRATYLNLDVESQRLLRTLREPVEEGTTAALGEFYEFIRSVPELRRLVRGDQVQRLTQQVRSYWKELVDGQFDRPYAASRMRIGVIHEQIGLEPQWYLVAIGRQVSGLLRAIPADHPELSSVLKALFRALYFDMTFVIDAYMEARAQSLLQARGFANQLMAGLTSAVVVVNDRRQVQFANESFLLFAGIEPAMLYKMDLAAIIAVPELLAAIDQLRREGSTRICSLGQWGERLLRMTVMELEKSPERRRRSIAVVLDDVSTMIRLTDTIEHDALLYKRLTNAVSAVVWEMDSDTQTIQSISQSVIDLIGCRDVALLGRPQSWSQYILPIDRVRFEASCEELVSKQRSTCEYRMVRSDGSEIWVRSHLSRLHRPSGKSGVVAVTLDITESRHSDQLRLAALENVAAGVAHVVNNALTAISGNIELYTVALKSNPNRLALETESCLDDAISASRRVASIISQLQTFAGGQYLRSRKLNVNDLIQQSLSTLRRQAGTSVQLRTELSAELWHCRVDPDLLKTSIVHLCEKTS